MTGLTVAIGVGVAVLVFAVAFWMYAVERLFTIIDERLSELERNVFPLGK